MPTTQPTPEPIVDKTPSDNPPSRNKIIILLGLAILVILFAGIAINQNKNRKQTAIDPYSAGVIIPSAKVNITKDGFEQATITIKLGQNVEWTNQDTAVHQIASDPHPTDDALVGLNDDTPLATGDLFSYVFDEPGTYTYHDELNPLGFKGVIIVED